MRNTEPAETEWLAVGMRKGHDLTGQRASFDAVGAAVLLLDKRGVVKSWTKDAEQLLGYAAVDVLGLNAACLLAPDDAARIPVLAEQCQRDGGWAGLLSLRRRDGRHITAGVRVVPITDSEGAERWLVMAADITHTLGRDMSRAVLDRMLTQLPVGTAVVDTDLRYVWSNAALEQFGGVPAQRRFGRRLGEVQPGLNAELIEAQMRQVLATGVPVTDYVHLGRPQADPHREHAYSMAFVRLEDETGHPLGVCYTVLDITDRYRSRNRLALLDRASGRIGRTLDVMRTAQELADVAVPGLADFVTVDLLDSVLKGAEPSPEPINDTGTIPLRRAGQQSVREGVPEAVVEIGGGADYHAWSPAIRTLTSGRSWRAAQLDPLAIEWATNIPGSRAARFKDLGLHTSMVVPMRARGITLGITAFFRRQRQESFEEDDLKLAEELVARAAVSIDNARRYTRERDAALALQHNLLPHGTPEQDAVDVAFRYRPADELAGVGGDWFDVIPLSGARVALVVGEVAGHGIDAAATMGRLRTAVQTLAELDLRPDELLAQLDDLVGRVSRERGTGLPAAGAQAVGASCLYVVYDPVSRQCSMASAGHPPPALITPDGTAQFWDLTSGSALGVGGLPFEADESVLEEGSVLALYTDGLFTTGEPDMDLDAGREQLRRALETKGLPLDDLCQTVVDHLVPSRPFDDVALLLARTHSLGVDQVATWDLPTDPAAVGHARAMATRQLSVWGLDEWAFTTELVISELVTNAIKHASGPIRLRLIQERTLICEVSDASSTSPHLRHPRATDEGGRGLFLISQFAQRWGTRYTANGKIIWAEQFLTPNGSEPGVTLDLG